MSGETEVKEPEYRSLMNVREMSLEQAAQAQPDASRLIALMATLSPELRFTIDYDKSSGISYVAAARYGVQHGFAMRGEMPYSKPPTPEDSRWSIQDVIEDVESNIIFMSRNAKNPNPVKGHYFCTGLEYEIPTEAMSVKASGRRINFWPVKECGIVIPENRPEKVSFNTVRSPIWVYKK